MTMKRKNIMWILIFLFPACLLYLLVFGIPTFTIILTSFTSWGLIHKAEFVGLQNYIDLFMKDDDFKAAIKNTFIWMLIQSTVHVSIGVLVGLILSKKPVGWKFVRTVYMIPVIVSPAAVAMLFLNMLSPQIGAVNNVIRLIGFKDFYQNWYNDSSTAFLTVIGTQLFFAAVITLLVMAEIAAIDRSIYESAEIDGATKIQADLHITLPMVKNIIGTCIILAASSIVTTFDAIYLTTNGGPGNSTLNLALLLYKKANLELNFGMANAIGVVQLAIGISSILLISKLFRIGKSIQ